MYHFFKWYAWVVTLGVAIFIILFLISINKTSEKLDTLSLSLEEKKDKVVQEKSWLDSLFNSKKLSYTYPINEVYVKVDLTEKITNTIKYQLSTVSLDPYQVFCLKAELKRYRFKYYFKKNGAKVELVIYSKNKTKLKALVKELKKFNIVARIKPYIVKEEM